ncbi:Phosphatidylinositol phosphatase PTPRQ-like isoform X2 [Oopsacas minuta]|uniref:Phosphatidylinositol phosphatase PTPRQ-like isoform X2 n=1 Tax=Oopsacas minuta TaxID=111878 RepID=A0AAV7KJ74_9METZ|nr:Phosphatidylinositol phosphatase PTPRQ-like isoform X2 [Oopsacas minuta]
MFHFYILLLNEISSLPYFAVPSSTVRNLTAVPSSSSITVSWYEPIMNDLNGVPTYYTLRYSGVEFQTEEKTVVVNYTSSGNETVSLTGLEAYTVYEISVTLSTSIGEGLSSSLEIRTLLTAPSSAPRNLQTSVLSANIISVTWDPPVSIDQNGILTLYTLTYKGIERDTTSRDIILYSNQSYFTNSILTDLDEFTYYDIEVSASTAAGSGPSIATSDRTEQEIPSAVPNNVMTTVLNSTAILLAWDAPDMTHWNGILLYYTLTYFGVELDRVVRVVNYTIEGSNHSNQTYEFSGLQEYTVYEFIVATHTNVGRGHAETVKNRTEEAVPSALPSKLNVQILSSSILIATWYEPPFSEQNGILTRYRITWRGLERDTEMRLEDIPVNSTSNTSYALTDLDAYTNYEVNVSSFTSVGAGPISSYTVTTLQDIPSSSVRNLTTSTEDQNATSIFVSWEVPILNDLNGILVNYSINYSGIEIDTFPRVIYLSNPNLTNQSITLIDLEEYTTYSINVSAYTKVGKGPDAIITQRTNQDVPTDIPTSFSANAISPNIINTTWEPPTAYHLGGIITSYTLTYAGRERHSLLKTKVLAVLNGSIYITPALTDLQEDTHYLISVRANTSVGAGPWTSLTVHTPEDVPSSSVRNLTTTTVGMNATSIYVSWEVPILNDLNGILVNYSINYSAYHLGGVITSYTLTYAGEERHSLLKTKILTVLNGSIYITPALTDLQEDTHYLISVRANTSVGAGPWANLTAHTTEDVPSSSVRKLTTSTEGMNATSIFVRWEVPILNDLNGILVNYSINYSGIEIDTVPRVIYLSNPNLTNQSITLIDLEEYTTYSINVSAYTKVGKGPDAIITQRTNQSAPSGVPLNLTAYPVTATIIRVEWNVPNIYFQNGVITNFTIRYTSLLFDTHRDFERVLPVHGNQTAFSFILSNLLESVTYEISVEAVTIMGSGPAEVIKASTFHTAPSKAPRNLLIHEVTTTSISLTWQPPEDEFLNGILDKYVLTYQGELLDRMMHVEEFPLSNEDDSFLQVAELTNLQENTTYTITIALFASGQMSPQIKRVVNTLDTIPSATVQNLTAVNASQFSVLIHWEEVPFREQNGRIVSYNLTTNFTHANTTSAPDLAPDFVRLNGTEVNFFLLKNLWYGVNFTVIVTPYTRHGAGPNISTTFMLDQETIPRITLPVKDEFITQSVKDNINYTRECVAEASPIPLIYWYKNDEAVPFANSSFQITITKSDLEEGLNAFVCRAINRQGTVNRTVNILLLSESVDNVVIEDTNDQIDNQETLDGEQVTNLANLVDSVIAETINDTIDMNTENKTNGTVKINLASKLFLNVIDRWDQNARKNDSNEKEDEVLFTTNTGLLFSTRSFQGGATNLTEYIDYTKCPPEIVRIYLTDETIATAIRAIDILIPKIVALNENQTNFTLATNGSMLESVVVDMTNSTEESMTFPKNTNGVNDTMRERVIIPNKQFFNESALRVTTTIIPGDGRNNTGIISVLLTHKSEPNSSNTSVEYSPDAIVNGTKTMNVLLQENITLVFPTLPPDDDKEYVCLALNDATGNWSSVGVMTLGFDMKTNTTSCTTSHLTSFAVLIQTKQLEVSFTEKIIGSTFSYILLCVSFVSLIITLILFFVAGRKFIKGDVHILYLNYTLAMLMAIGCFIIGVESVHSVDVLCTMIGLFLHYSWLSVFSWSMCNGILIFYLLFIGIMTPKRIWPYLLIIGWGLPMPIVIISSAVTQSAYTGNNTGHCWISTESGLIWSFLGPVYFILFVNCIILVCSAIRIATARKKQKHLLRLKSALYSAVILTPVLGLPWVVSLAKVATVGIEHETVQAILDRFVDWTFICLNAPCGIIFMIIIAIRVKEFRKSNKKSISTRQTSVQHTFNTLTIPKSNQAAAPLANKFKKTIKPPPIRIHVEKPEATIFASNLIVPTKDIDKDKLDIPVGCPPRPFPPKPAKPMPPQSSTLDYSTIKCEDFSNIHQNPTCVSIEDITKIFSSHHKTEALDLDLETYPMEENIYQNIATIEQGPEKPEKYSTILHDLAIPNPLFVPLDQIEIDLPVTKSAPKAKTSITSTKSFELKTKNSTTFANYHSELNLQDNISQADSARSSPVFERDQGILRRSLKKMSAIFKLSTSQLPQDTSNVAPARPPPPPHFISKGKVNESSYHNTYLEHLHKIFNDKQQDSNPKKSDDKSQLTSTLHHVSQLPSAPKQPAPYQGRVKAIRERFDSLDRAEVKRPIGPKSIRKPIETELPISLPSYEESTYQNTYADYKSSTKIDSIVIEEQPPSKGVLTVEKYNPFMTTSFTQPSQNYLATETISPVEVIGKKTENIGCFQSDKNTISYMEPEPAITSITPSRSAITISDSPTKLKRTLFSMDNTSTSYDQEETPLPSTTSISPTKSFDFSFLTASTIESTPPFNPIQQTSLPEPSLDSKLQESVTVIPEIVTDTDSHAKIPAIVPPSSKTEVIKIHETKSEVTKNPVLTEKIERKNIQSEDMPSRDRVVTSPKITCDPKPRKVIIRPRSQLNQDNTNFVTGLRSTSTSPVKRSTKVYSINSISSDQYHSSNSTSATNSTSASPTQPLSFTYKPPTDLTKVIASKNDVPISKENNLSLKNPAPVIARKPEIQFKTRVTRDPADSLPLHLSEQIIYDSEKPGAFSKPQTQKPQHVIHSRSSSSSSYSGRLSDSSEIQLRSRKGSSSKISDKIAFFDTASQGDAKSLPRPVRRSSNSSRVEITTSISPVKGISASSNMQMKGSKSFNDFSVVLSPEKSNKQKSGDGLNSHSTIKSPPVIEIPEITDL